MELYKKILSEISIMNGAGLLRIFLSKNEIIACNEMVKLDYLEKGKGVEKNATIAFFITKKGEEYLEKN